MEDVLHNEVQHLRIDPRGTTDQPVVDPRVLLTTQQVGQDNISPHSQLVQNVRTGYAFDELMTQHAPITEADEDHPEGPGRIIAIRNILREHRLMPRMKHLPGRHVTREEVCLVHSEDHWNFVQSIKDFSYEDFASSSQRFQSDSLYVSHWTTDAAERSCGGGITAALAVAKGEVQNAFAIIRPPGHHAEPEKAMGFCFFSNIAVAARVVQRETSIRRIMIVDWDVHHGNGTQKAFYDDENILFISIHRYDNGDWYPGGPEGGMDYCGVGQGLGRNINIPWPAPGMGDADYLYAFMKIIMPIAYEFAPELVMISAGFDAAAGDPLGECEVSPAGFAHMTELLSPLAGGKLVVLLEGGYNVRVISEASLAVVKILLGDAPPVLGSLVASAEATETVYRVALIQSRYWRSIDHKGLEPSEEEDPDTVISMPELLKSHRTAFMAESYGVQSIPFANVSLHESFHEQVLVTKDIYTAKTLLLFIHDFGNIYGELRGTLTCDLNVEHSYMVDASRHVADLATTKGWALVDVNTFARWPPLRSKADIATIRDVIYYVWDNYVELSDATQIIFISHGSAAKAMTELINGRRVNRRVTAVVQVWSMNDEISTFRIDEEQKPWFVKHSLLVVPNEHPAEVEKGKILRKRYGEVVPIAERRVSKVLKTAMPDIQRFIEESINQGK